MASCSRCDTVLDAADKCRGACAAQVVMPPLRPPPPGRRHKLEDQRHAGATPLPNSLCLFPPSVLTAAAIATTAQSLVFFCEEDVHLRELLARWTMAFPRVLMCHLRENMDTQKEVAVSRQSGKLRRPGAAVFKL